MKSGDRLKQEYPLLLCNTCQLCHFSGTCSHGLFQYNILPMLQRFFSILIVHAVYYPYIDDVQAVKL